jgi:ferredoxin
MKFELRHKSKIHEWQSDRPGVLLDQIESAGFAFPFGCREASCGVCRIQVLAGGDLLDPPTISEEDTLARCHDPPNVRLACSARIQAAGAERICLADPPPVVLPSE